MEILKHKLVQIIAQNLMIIGKNKNKMTNKNLEQKTYEIGYFKLGEIITRVEPSSNYGEAIKVWSNYIGEEDALKIVKNKDKKGIGKPYKFVSVVNNLIYVIELDENLEEVVSNVFELPQFKSGWTKYVNIPKKTKKIKKKTNLNKLESGLNNSSGANDYRNCRATSNYPSNYQEGHPFIYPSGRVRPGEFGYWD